jgi:hypothetical protein
MPRSPAALLLLVLGIGCQGHSACTNFCFENRPAMFVLSCSPTDLTDVTASGPCSFSDASGPTVAGTSLQIGSPTPGICHVTLTFATGFTYSTDVTFVSQTTPAPPGCGGCSPYIAPTQREFAVDNPSTTYVDAGADAGVD